MTPTVPPPSSDDYTGPSWSSSEQKSPESTSGRSPYSPSGGGGSGASGGGGNWQPPKKRKKSFSPLLVIFLFSGFFFILFMVISGLLFFGGSPGGSDWAEESSSQGIFAGKKDAVGVVEIRGVIFDSKKTLKKLKRFEDDDDVKAIVVRLDSPGGSVAPSQEVFEALKDYPKPVVASMGAVAASGAFYISCGAKKVFANPGTLTGSIGVIISFTNLAKLYEWAKIERYDLTTGKYKAAGSDHQRLTKDQEKLFQTMLDDVLVQFKTAVSEGRKIPMKEVDAVADGRIMTGSQAFNLKLVDQLGTIDDAITEAAKMGGIEGEPEVIYYRKRRSGISNFLFPPGPDDEDAKMTPLSKSILQVFFGKEYAEQGVSPFKPQAGLYWLWQGFSHP